jgi:outer membrane protein assembly factor BamB
MGRVRLSLLLLALLAAAAGVLAGCSARETALRVMRPPQPEKRQSTWVHVAVVDGDRGRRVRGALVRIGRFHDRTDRRGVAKIPLRRRAALVVKVKAKRFAPESVRLQFRGHPKRTVRIYQPSLQWTMYGATPARTQTQPRIHLRPPFRIVWSRGVGSFMEFPAVVSDGVAFVGNYRGTVRAFSMRNGARIWRANTDGKMAASPAALRDEVVVHGMHGHVYVLDRHNGRVLWRFNAGGPIESSPVVRDGVDYFGAWNGRVYALDLRRRRVRWLVRTGYKITSSVALSGATAYVGDYGGRVFALSTRTGRTRWVGHVNGRIYGTPAVAAGRVFVSSSSGGSLTAFSRSGARLWSIGTGAYVYASPAVWAGRVYFGSYTGRLYCVSAARGSVLWSFASGAPIAGAPVVVDRVVYFANRYHRVYALSARRGRLLMRFPDGAFVPVSGNGGRLLLHGFSRLYAVEPRHR